MNECTFCLPSVIKTFFSLFSQCSQLLSGQSTRGGLIGVSVRAQRDLWPPASSRVRRQGRFRAEAEHYRAEGRGKRAAGGVGWRRQPQGEDCATSVAPKKTSPHTPTMCDFFMSVDVNVCPGRVQATVLLCSADRPGHLLCARQAADAEWHLRPHHQTLPLLPHCGQGLAGRLSSFFIFYFFIYFLLFFQLVIQIWQPLTVRLDY